MITKEKVAKILKQSAALQRLVEARDEFEESLKEFDTSDVLDQEQRDAPVLIRAAESLDANGEYNAACTLRRWARFGIPPR